MAYYKITQINAVDPKTGEDAPIGTILTVPKGKLHPLLVNKGIYVQEAPKEMKLVVNPATKKRGKQKRTLPVNKDKK